MGTGSVDFRLVERDRKSAPRRGGARRFLDFSDGPIEDLGPVPAVQAGSADKDDAETAVIASRLADRFDVVGETHSLAVRSMAQAREALDGLMGAAYHALDAFSGQAQTAGADAKSLTDTAMRFATEDIAISFEYATRLARARDLEEVLRLQAEYLQAHMQLFAEPLADRKKE